MEWLTHNPLLPPDFEVEFYFDDDHWSESGEAGWPLMLVACTECGAQILRIYHPDYIFAETCSPNCCLSCTFDLES